LAPAAIQPRIAGSIDRKRLRTTNWPSAGSGKGASRSSHSSGVMVGEGRATRTIWRLVVGSEGMVLLGLFGVRRQQ
jgi:hypothetical protein